MLLVAMAGVSAMAQYIFIDNSSDDESYFGIRVGEGLVFPGKVTVGDVGLNVFNSGIGVEIGGVYHHSIATDFYVEPGLKFVYNAYSLKDDYVKALQDDMIFNSISLKKFGIAVPVMAGYSFELSDEVLFSVFTGPELEIGLSAKEHIKGENIEMSGSVYGDNGDMRRVDFLWDIGVGISYQKFCFEVKGGIGLLNKLDAPDMKFRENRLALSVGYNF